MSSERVYAIMPPTDSSRWTLMMLWSELCFCALVDLTCRQSAFSDVQRAAIELGSLVFASALEAAILHTCGLSQRIFGQDILFLVLCTESHRRYLLMLTSGKSANRPIDTRASVACGTGARMNHLWPRVQVLICPLLSSASRRQRATKARSCHLWSQRSAHPHRRGMFRSSRSLMVIRVRNSAINASFVRSPSFAISAG